jgi:hypothetical protein
MEKFARGAPAPLKSDVVVKVNIGGEACPNEK